jgi:hypothetical protein
MENSNQNPLTLKTIAAVTAYFLVIFYFFGAVDTNYNIIYPSFPKIHEHYDEYMSVFNAATRILLTYSSFALIGTSLALLWFRPNSFPRPAIWISIILASSSAIATLFFIMPIHLSLWVSGYNEALFQKLMTITYYFQFIPSLAQILIGFWLLNRYLDHIKFISRWVFILFITITFYTTNYGNFCYLLYITVGTTDWAAFRAAILPPLFFIGLLIAFTPMLLTIPMFWLRPKSVPRYFVGIYGLIIYWIFFISAFYIASKVQGYLEHNYSRLRTEELINADFMYRILPGMILTFIAVYMFVKAGQEKMEKQNLN